MCLVLGVGGELDDRAPAANGLPEGLFQACACSHGGASTAWTSRGCVCMAGMGRSRATCECGWQLQRGGGT